MSFFIRKKVGKSNNIGIGDRKRKNTDLTKSKSTSNGNVVEKRSKKQQADDEELDSDFEDDCALNDEVPDVESEEDSRETAQEKRLRLAKIYLGEIEREEKERAESSVIDTDVIANRLKDDFLESTGKLKKRVADNYVSADHANVAFLKCKEHNLSITCLVLSSDNSFIYSGSKDGAIVKWSLTDRRKLKSIPRGKKGSKDKNNGHTTSVQCIAVTSDNKFLATGSNSNDVHVWSADTLQRLHLFQGHRGPITSLVFRRDTHQLYSGSQDRSVKIWSLDEMAYIETLFGHQSGVTSIDALSRERAITAGGRDNTVRIWKVVEESQLIFNGHKGSIDAVRLISEEHFVTCGDDGDLCIWGAMKKRPLCVVNAAHGIQPDNQLANWISSVATYLNTDLIATGSRNGFVRLWKCAVGYRSLEPLMAIPVAGFINSLAFTSDGSHLVVGVGQEHRLGRWWTIKEAKNGIYVIPFVINKEEVNK